MQNTLFDAIRDLKIGSEDSALSFSQRLARENGWTLHYAEKCIDEYKKFIYLAAISKQGVTPSDQVDQVWHLHLSYTRSYWVDLCQNILGHHLHHDPTEGGEDESEKYREQYQATIKQYIDVFGEFSPEDIWPSLSERFKDADKFIRLNSKAHWVVKKPSAWTLPIAMTSLLLVACTQTSEESDLWFWIKVVVGIYVAYKVIKWLNSRGGGNGGSGGSGSAGCGSSCGSGCGGCGS